MEIFNGYLLGDSKELQSQMNDNMEDENDTLLEETISKLDGSKLEEYLTKQYKIRELIPSQELAVVSELYDYLYNMQQFYQICIDDQYSVFEKMSLM
ncbi:hypothetical protein FDP41_008885 [Naegleria fowleri]|uniref:Uncharacterized protein n=1 Tax=Naegleria fowleri TaxID=5763 RepID=A0A6A5BD69_NAEFO|nr:uncharacterized protein FDP41_008885 [Naegleria fowleri]KAF0972636.1 hypothetical protein FDP41_008885 [Naegleria fowleri]